MSEQWLPVVGFERFYEISSFGRVRRIYQTKAGRDVHKPLPFVLTPIKNSSGYFLIGFFDGKSRTVHSLVCAAFIGPRPKGFDISHKDLDKSNNRADNLEYLSRRDHLIYSFAQKERLPWQKSGEENSNATLNTEQVHKIKRLLNTKESQEKIAAMFGVSQATIWRIAHGHCWKKAL